MKIASADIQMTSAHNAFSRTETSERLQMWSGPRGESNRQQGQVNGAAPSTRVALSPEALAASAADPVSEAADPLDADPRLKLMATMIEFLTGRPVRLMRLDEVAAGSRGASTDTPAAPPSRQANSPAAAAGANGENRENGANGAGFGIEYDFSSSRIEYERTTFQADGVIRTTDGREIRFEVSFAMERSFVESTNVSLRAGEPRVKDPLVLDFGGPAASLQNTRFAFDLDSDGTLEQVPLPGGGRGFLAIDRNDNGRIDNGRELFGPSTGQGFAELAALDADKNGWIDAADPAYAQLRVWQPAADGQGVVQTLTEAGVGAFFLGKVATPFDLRDPSNETLGVMRASSVYLGQDGRVGTVSQIDLSV